MNECYESLLNRRSVRKYKAETSHKRIYQPLCRKDSVKPFLPYSVVAC